MNAESKIVALCRQLHNHVAAQQANGGGLSPDPRLQIPIETRDFIINWLNEDPRVSTLLYHNNYVAVYG